MKNKNKIISKFFNELCSSIETSSVNHGTYAKELTECKKHVNTNSTIDDEYSEETLDDMLRKKSSDQYELINEKVFITNKLLVSNNVTIHDFIEYTKNHSLYHIVKKEGHLLNNLMLRVAHKVEDSTLQIIVDVRSLLEPTQHNNDVTMYFGSLCQAIEDSDMTSGEYTTDLVKCMSQISEKITTYEFISFDEIAKDTKLQLYIVTINDIIKYTKHNQLIHSIKKRNHVLEGATIYVDRIHTVIDNKNKCTGVRIMVHFNLCNLIIKKSCIIF